MKTALLFLFHLIGSLVKLAGPDGARGLDAETLLLKYQLLISNRGQKRATNLSFIDPRVVVAVRRGYVARSNKR